MTGFVFWIFMLGKWFPGIWHWSWGWGQRTWKMETITSQHSFFKLSVSLLNCLVGLFSSWTRMLSIMLWCLQRTETTLRVSWSEFWGFNTQSVREATTCLLWEPLRCKERPLCFQEGLIIECRRGMLENKVLVRQEPYSTSPCNWGAQFTQDCEPCLREPQ